MISEYCAICGKEFKIFPCRKNVTKCCSYECRNKLIVKTRRELYEKSKMKLHKINYEDKSTMLLSYMDKTIMKGEDDLS